MVGGKERRERTSGTNVGNERRERSGNNNDDELICVITRLSIKSERNFSDYINGINSINSGNVYDVYGYGYRT